MKKVFSSNHKFRNKVPAINRNFREIVAAPKVQFAGDKSKLQPSPARLLIMKYVYGQLWIWWMATGSPFSGYSEEMSSSSLHIGSINAPVGYQEWSASPQRSIKNQWKRLARQRLGPWQPGPGNRRYNGRKRKVRRSVCWRSNPIESTSEARGWREVLVSKEVRPLTVENHAWISDQEIPTTPPTAAEEKQKEEECTKAQRGRRRSRKSIPVTPQGIKPYISGMGGVSITFKTVAQTVEVSRKEVNIDLPKNKEAHKVEAEKPSVVIIEEEIPLHNTPKSNNQVNMEVEDESLKNLSPHEDDEEYIEAEDDLEGNYDDDDLIGEELAEMEMEEGLEKARSVENEEVNDGLNPILSVVSKEQVLSCIPPVVSMNNLAIVANTFSTSDSLKRKGEEGGDEDTASSKPKRSSANPIP